MLIDPIMANNAQRFMTSHRLPTRSLFLLLTILLLKTASGYGQHGVQNTAATERPETTQPISLVEVSKQVSVLLNKRVVVDRDTPASIPVVTTNQRHSPDSLTSIRKLLHENGLILFDGKDAAMIVRQERARRLPLPVIRNTTMDRSEFEWVTLVAAIGDLQPKAVVVKLRQTIPAYGHMAIHSDAQTAVVTGPFGLIRQFLAELKQLQQQQ